MVLQRFQILYAVSFGNAFAIRIQKTGNLSVLRWEEEKEAAVFLGAKQQEV